MGILKTPPLRIGVLGATGYIGAPYRREMRECDGVRIIGLCARRRTRLEAAGREDGAVCLTDDWREIVRHPEIDLVVVATPDALHHEAVMACAAAGKHVLCEKPLGANAREAREMFQAYQARPALAHFVPFWVRYAAGMRRARELVRDGTLGDIRGVIYRWHNPRPAAMPYTWRDNPDLSAAGSIADVGSHAYDTVRWILGDAVQRVLAHAATLSSRTDAGEINLEEALEWGGTHSAGAAPRKEAGTFDYATIAWEFTRGAVGVLVLSHAPAFRKGIAPELELHGSQASLGVDRVSGNLTLAKPGGLPEIIDTLPDIAVNRFQQHVFPAIHRALANASTGEDPTLEDGWRVQLFTDAVLASARRGAWVDLTEIEQASALPNE